MDSQLSQLSVERIGTLLTSADGTGKDAVHPVQIEHRIEVAKRFFGTDSGHKNFSIEGQNVLEIGCGQGDFTIVLAELVGDKGKVVAIDPAPLDYGAPLSLGQAQGILTASSIGSRISFQQADVPAFFASAAKNGSPFEVALLVHSLFYFASEAELLQTLKTLKESGHVKNLCIAEYSLTVSQPEAISHLLSMVAQSFLPKEDANIRTLFSPAQIKRLAEEAGFKLQGESIIQNPGIQDGRWEVQTTLGLEQERKANAGSLAENSGEQRNLLTFSTLCDSIRANLPTTGVKGVTCADVWTATFTAA
ncbi:hypothetical protein OC861_001216 [Tilletia horrida]|nr:hypothetical protein OC861_001216 [Tilletia horrida]